MSRFVLVHGAFHGAWCWYRLLAWLRAQGRQAEALDLPGHGRDRTPVEAVTLDAYVARVVQALDASPEPVVLVGHSMGGGVITQAAEARPQRLRTLVYVGALLPRAGETMLQLLQEVPAPEPAARMRLSEDRRRLWMEEPDLHARVYPDCRPEDAALAGLLLVEQATQPLLQPIRTTEAGFGRVPRVYVECRDDRAVPLALQRAMHARLPCRVETLETGHFPMLSMPERLGALLLEADARAG